jgi:hypothetical protein
MATKKPLLRFWNALDEIPNATTDRREWSLRLGDDWSIAAAYLKPTGRLVREIDCPSPGGDGCPRKLINRGDGQFRAVCGCRPAECDPVDLTLDDITSLTLDRAKLATVISAIFDASGNSTAAADIDGAMPVGSHGVAAGISIPVMLLIPGPTTTVPNAAFTSVLGGDKPAAIAVPTTRSISPAMRSSLSQHGHVIFFLTEIVTEKDHCLSAACPARELLAPLRERLLASLSPAVKGRLWVLPPGTRWQDLTFDFVAEEVVNVRFGSETRRFEPEHFGLKSKKNGRPTSGWVLLRSIAQQGGTLTWRDPRASDKIKKQKQLLSGRLRSLFGIGVDPILTRGTGYQALFTIRDSTTSAALRRRGG